MAIMQESEKNLFKIEIAIKKLKYKSTFPNSSIA